MTFHEKVSLKFAELKRQHGTGVYSWAEGMTRRIARKIARDVVRREEKVSHD